MALRAGASAATSETAAAIAPIASTAPQVSGSIALSPNSMLTHAMSRAPTQKAGIVHIGPRSRGPANPSNPAWACAKVIPGRSAPATVSSLPFGSWRGRTRNSP